MFQRLVRVILTASVSGFTSGMRQSQNAFQRFVRGIPTGVILASQALQGLESVVRLVSGAFNMARRAAENFFSGAMAIERAETVLTHMTGSAEAASTIMDDLRRRSEEYGIAVTDSLEPTQQLASGLKGLEGQVDPDRLSRLVDIIQATQQLRGPLWRPDRGAIALINALAGDFTSFIQVFDVKPELMSGLSEATQAFLTAGKEGTEKALGAFTHLGDNAVQLGGDALAAIEEVLAAAGQGGALLEVFADSAEVELARVRQAFTNMKNDIALNILPAFTEVLGEILRFLEENPDAIDDMVTALSNLGTTGLEELIELLNATDPEALAQGLSRIATSIGQIATQIERVSELGNTPFFQWLNRNLGEGGALEGGPTAVGQRAGESTRGAIGDFLGMRSNPAGEGSGSLTHPQRVDVVVTVEDGNIEAYVDNRANNAAAETIGQVVDAATKGSLGGPAGGRR